MIDYSKKLSEIFGYPIDQFALDEKFHHFAADNPRKKPLWVIGSQWPYNGQQAWSLNYGSFQDPSIRGKLNSWDELPFQQTKNFMKTAREKQAVLQAKVNQEKQKRHIDCKTKSVSTFKDAQKIENHDYLVKKQIKPFVAKRTIDEYGNELLTIPAYDAAGMVGLQYINKNGQKWFSSGIKISGAFCNLKPFRNSRVIYLCEGYATACSLQMATDIPVLFCFTANNIEKSIKTIRKINPGCFIRLCGDNDKVNDKTGYRPGKHYATLAQMSDDKTSVVYPFEDENTIGDFNDLHVQISLESVRRRIEFDLLEIEKEYEKRVCESGFSYFNEKGNVVRDYEKLLNYFIYKTNYFYVSEIKRIYIYNGQFYEPADDGFVRKFAQDHFVPYCDTKNQISEFLELVKRVNVVPQSYLQSNDNFIPFRNGLYDYKSNEFIEHTPTVKTFHVIPHDFDPKAKAPVFEKMLNNLMLDRAHLVDLINEIFGFCLSGITYEDFQKFFIFQGGGRNGKSTLIDCLGEMLGQRNISSIELTSLTTNRFAAIKLENSLVNFSEEEPKECFKSTGVLKKLVGHSFIQVEEKNKPSYTTINKSKLIVSYNEIPFLFDLSKGMQRRMTIIPFDVDLRESPERSIEDVRTKLLAEMPGIINFAIEGIKRLLKNKNFTFSQESNDMVAKMVKDSSPIEEFLHEECQIIPGERTSTERLYEEFITFSGAKMSKRMFVRELLNRDKRLNRGRTQYERVIENIVLSQGQAIQVSQNHSVPF